MCCFPWNCHDAQVNEVQYALDQQTAQDRQMERSFKKDFQELPEEVFSQLQTISKTWRRCKPVDNLLAASNSTDLLVLDVCKRDFCDVVEETPPADQPQGCDTSTWQLFMKWYQSKAQSENSLIALQSDLNEMRSLSDYISQEYERWAVRMILETCTSSLLPNTQFNSLRPASVTSVVHAGSARSVRHA